MKRLGRTDGYPWERNRMDFIDWLGDRSVGKSKDQVGRDRGFRRRQMELRDIWEMIWDPTVVEHPQNIWNWFYCSLLIIAVMESHLAITCLPNNSSGTRNSLLSLKGLLGACCWTQQTHISLSTEKPNWSLHPFVLVSFVWKGTLQPPERRRKYQSGFKTLDLQYFLLSSYVCQGNGNPELWEQPTSIWFKAHSTRTSFSKLLDWPKNRDWVPQRYSVKPNATVFF